ncbi:MAG: tetratricopeptide repeat protein [Loktanella sp.]|nr:tetratricopeptide repeat protein [Loktanella sp.]
MLKTTIRAAALIGALGAAPVASADPAPGAYLAARQAAAANDYQSAAGYFTKALMSDPQNPFLMEGAMASYLSLGAMDQAVPIARSMRETGIESQIAHLALLGHDAASDNWDAIFNSLEEGHEVSPLVDGLVQGWAALGQGAMDRAVVNFDSVIEAEGMRGYGLYHKALALALVGDFEAAEETFRALNDRGAFSARAAIAHAQVLSQLDRNDEARDILTAAFNVDQAPLVRDITSRLEADESVPFDIVDSPRAGVAEVMFMIVNVLQDDTPDGYVLHYARLAEYLDPSHTEALIVTAALLERLGRYDLAGEAFARVPKEDPAYQAAEIGRIDVLYRADRLEAASEAAQALARDFPDTWGRALDLIDADNGPGRVSLYFARAITSHTLDDWPEAEADFRAALEIMPSNAGVLNYLGYSLVERGENLDEALDMIERAAAAQPDNGAIIDSLGWVLFKLGDYEEAVGYMEHAVTLEAVDPIVNDHLGDVYWAVGRKTEAHFQWKRALSFGPEPELADRIKRKLEIGLDAVLSEEGRAPLTVADDSP